MVRNTAIALRALHEILVAARNIALENPSTPIVADIVDAIEPIPIWIADTNIDHTDNVINTFEQLSLSTPNVP